VNNQTVSFLKIHKFTHFRMVKPFEFVCFHINRLDNYFQHKAAPLRFVCRLLPSVIYIFILEMVFLFTGLNVTLRGSIVKLYDGLRMLVEKESLMSVFTLSASVMNAISRLL